MMKKLIGKWMIFAVPVIAVALLSLTGCEEYGEHHHEGSDWYYGGHHGDHNGSGQHHDGGGDHVQH